jgi:hypothetical protein
MERLLDENGQPTAALVARLRSHLEDLEAPLGTALQRTRIAGFGGALYVCPCGGDGCCAWLPDEIFHDDEGQPLSESPGSVLTCFDTGRQWLVPRIDVAATVKAEEETYLALLSRADKVIARTLTRRPRDETTVRFLQETHGIPEEISRDLMGLPAPKEEVET